MMDRDDLRLFFIALSGIASVILVYFRVVDSQTDYLSPIRSAVSGWVGNALLLVAGLYIAWSILKWLFGSLLKEASKEHIRQSLDEIEGCVEKDGIAWQGTAHFAEGRVQNIYLPYDPTCPECQTGMVDRTDQPSSQEQRQNSSYSQDAQPTPIFACPNEACGHTAERTSNQTDEVEKLLERHAKRIVETVDEPYSLSSLVEGIEDGITPRRVWKEYVSVVDDEQVSTNCFH
ncbi:hypothetical protein ACOZ4N_01300 (plasmid) [Halorientalis pallida]|uniref:hypothetical protein n=1 Tax=Halorientalis pallida TaxID=2479928 RepID=UPI003C6F5976